MNRADLQHLSMIRLKEARALFHAEYFSGTYYLAGYAIECALKACIAKLTDRYDFPEKDRVLSSYTHDLKKLVTIAQLETELNREFRNDIAFATSWNVVKDWSENARYEVISRERAEKLLAATENRTYGVLPWIKRRW